MWWQFLNLSLKYISFHELPHNHQMSFVLFNTSFPFPFARALKLTRWNILRYQLPFLSHNAIHLTQSSLFNPPPPVASKTRGGENINGISFMLELQNKALRSTRDQLYIQNKYDIKICVTANFVHLL